MVSAVASICKFRRKQELRTHHAFPLNLEQFGYPPQHGTCLLIYMMVCTYALYAPAWSNGSLIAAAWYVAAYTHAHVSLPPWHERLLGASELETQEQAQRARICLQSGTTSFRNKNDALMPMKFWQSCNMLRTLQLAKLATFVHEDLDAPENHIYTCIHLQPRPTNISAMQLDAQDRCQPLKQQSFCCWYRSATCHTEDSAAESHLDLIELDKTQI